MKTRAQIWRRWVFACAAGETLGIGAAAGAAVLVARAFGPEPLAPSARWMTLLAFVAAGAVEGGALALLQWGVLRHRLPRLRVREWVGVTVALAMLGWLIGMAGPTFASGAPQPQAEPPLGRVLAMAAGIGLGAGALFGAAQAWVLKDHAPRAGRWVWINALGWAPAMAFIFLGAGLPEPGWPGWALGLSGAVGGLLGGASLGLVTGASASTLEPWVDERGWNLDGKVCVVSGGTSGIGLEVAKGLARMGGHVVFLCRDPVRGAKARAKLRAGAQVDVVPCDLASLASVRAAAEVLKRRVRRIDVLVHDAGAVFKRRTLTDDGVEATLAVDVVGPFALTRALLPLLECSHARVITLAGAVAHGAEVHFEDLHFAHRAYSWAEANRQAQRARVLFTAELARREPKLSAWAVHPGAVVTPAQRVVPLPLRLLVWPFTRPAFLRPELGAMSVLRLAAAPSVGPSGSWFNRFRRVAERVEVDDSAALWRACEAMVAPRRAAPPSPEAPVHLPAEVNGADARLVL